MDIRETFDEYKNCALCPRNCNVDRTVKPGFCRESGRLSIDSALIHHGEEPCISFNGGSGTIFFTGCSLRCPFCQNMQISHNPENKKYYSTAEFIDIMEGLIKKGAENINFVTPDHFLPHLIEGIKHLNSRGYRVPYVYNSSGFQSVDSLRIACEYIDIYLIDYKFADREAAAYCINNNQYPDVARDAIDFLFGKKGNLKLNPDGKAVSGVIVRHLVMPGFAENSIDVINNLFFDYGRDIFLSLMCQYTPRYLKNGFDKINRRLTKEEYERVADHVISLGFTNGYIQEFIEGEDRYIPDFEKKSMYDEW